MSKTVFSDVSSSEDEVFTSTPPNIMEMAEESTKNLLPEKSKGRYNQVYKFFMDWRLQNKVKSFSENVMMAYFGEIAKKYKPSTLWCMYSMLRMQISMNHDVDISKYCKLTSFLKRKNDGFKPKKSKILTAEEINRFLLEAPDEKHLMNKVSKYD